MVLIESDWNLKCLVNEPEDRSGLVLIESDWNLKYCKMSLYITADIVLIESDWNLKLFSLYGIGWPVICINRIRLEFKENKIGEGVKSWDSINRIRLEFKVLAMSRPLSFAHTY